MTYLARRAAGAHTRFCLRALFLSAALPLATQATAAAASWDSTLSKAIPSSILSGATALPSTQALNVHVSLHIQNKSALDQFVAKLYTPGSAQYHHYLTPAQFTVAYAPSAAQAQSVVSYLQSAGLSHVTLAANRLLVDATGSVATIESAFNTKLVQGSYHGRTVRANVTDIQVPSSLGDVVLAVLGPSNLENFQTGIEQAQAQAAVTPALGGSVLSGYLGDILSTVSSAVKVLDGSSSSVQPMPSFPPTAWNIAYGGDGTPDGSQATIAISTYESEAAVVVQDLRQMEKQFGLPYVPVEIRETPAFTTPTPSGSGDDEWDLDTQSSTAMAHNVKKLIIYVTPETTDLIDEYNTFATQADAIAGNMSYGVCELLADVGYVLPGLYASDQAFEQAAAEGLSWHASSGDNGGSCNVATTGIPLSGVPLIANYPSSSPYVVGVGGTALFTDANYNYAGEIAEPSGGGGISLIEAAPSWQKGIVPTAVLSSIPTGSIITALNPLATTLLTVIDTALSSVGLLNPTSLGGNGIGRGVPDIAMNFGFYTPEGVVTASAADVIIAGSHFEIFGTSLSSPLAVGAWARLQSAHCNSLGFAAPAYYALDTSGGLLSTAKGFHDVTIGTIGDFLATPGWDYATGFGSIDLAAVGAALPAAPEGCVPVPSTPAASLKLSSASGAAPLPVSYDASASDPSGDTISYYTLDYGDNALPLQQTSPTFAAHTYAAPGIYTVSLTVRNSHGGVSKPVTKTVTVAGVPVSCSVPGVSLINAANSIPAIPIPVVTGEWDVVGGELAIVLQEANTVLDLLPPPLSAVASAVNTLENQPDIALFLNTGQLPDPIPAQALVSASVAEPASMPGQLVFTLKAGSLSALPPLTTWGVSFTLPGAPVSASYYVAMSTNAGGNPSFAYGQNGSIDGFLVAFVSSQTQFSTLATTSGYNADGTITLVLPEAALGLTTGETLWDIEAYTAIQATAAADVDGTSTQLASSIVVDGGTSPWGYTLAGTKNCAASAGSSGGSTGGSSGGSPTGSSGSSPVGSPSGSSGGSSGNSSGASSDTTAAASSGTAGGGGAFGAGALLPLLAGAAWRRRRRLTGS